MLLGNVSCGLPSLLMLFRDAEMASQTFVRILLVGLAASSHTSKTSKRNAPLQDTPSGFLRHRLPRRAAFAQSNPITHHEQPQLSVSSASKIEREPAINSRAYNSYPRRRRRRLRRHQHRFDGFRPYTPPSQRLTSRVTAGLMRFCTCITTKHNNR